MLKMESLECVRVVQFTEAEADLRRNDQETKMEDSIRKKNMKRSKNLNIKIQLYNMLKLILFREFIYGKLTLFTLNSELQSKSYEELLKIFPEKVFKIEHTYPM